MGRPIRFDCSRFVLTLLAALFSCAAAAADLGAIVMHGKWGTPEGPVKPVADALAREGVLVASPEMPWSRRRLYDKSVEGADAEIDAEIAALRSRGAKRIILVGHSLGAAYALHYASRGDVDGVVAIAPGHRTEAPRFADHFRPAVTDARALVAAGKGAEVVSFTDLNTGNRRDHLTASAASFLSYFDHTGPLNMARNVKSMKAGVPVLWIVPLREEPAPRPGVLALFRSFPANPDTQLAEPDADHINAPAASTRLIVEWVRKLGSR
jgi:pimeloyl-ACP methyl ester carboxylesterase